MPLELRCEHPRAERLCCGPRFYDPTSGQVATITDPRSYVTTLTSDPGGNVTNMATPDGHSSSWSFNTAGDLAMYTAPNGATINLAYDTAGRGLVVTAANGVPPGYGMPGPSVTLVGAYDNAGQLTGTRDGRGNWWTETLDTLGRPLTQSDPLGDTGIFKYDLNGDLTDYFDPTGGHTQYGYNNRSWITSVTDPNNKTSYNTFDVAGNLTQFKDALSQVTGYTYSALNQLVSVTSPMSHTTNLAYWPNGLFKSETDPMGHVSNTSYNWTTKQITTTAAAGTSVAQTTTDTIDAAGNLVSAADGLGHTTTYTLNPVNVVTAVTDPLSHTATATLTALSTLRTLTDPNGHTTTITSDILGRPTMVTDATGRKEQEVYDANDNVVATIDNAGDTTKTTFDAANRPNILTDANGNQVQQLFDPAGRVYKLIDANNNATVWQFDKAGNPTVETDPNNATVAWTYDADNEVTSRTDQLGRSETYSYNPDGMLTTAVWKNASGTTVNTLTYGYNADDLLTSASDNSGTYSFTRDALGRITAQTDIWGLTLNFTWDAGNRITGVADSLGGSVVNTFDNANELTDTKFTDTSGNALSVHYAYDPAGELTGISRYSDATETTPIGSSAYAYDNAGRITSITHKYASGTTLDAFNYTYNAAGLVASETSTLGPTTTDTYDRAGQLIGDGTSTWSYDKEGNRNSTGYTTGAGNTLTSDGTWNYSYDSAGNLVQETNIGTGAVWLYSYDNRNQMVEADHKPSSAGAIDYKEVYTNDVFGNRIAVAVYPTGSGTPTITHYAFDPAGNCWADLTSGGSLITRRLTDAELGVVFARISGTTVNWYLADQLGSVRDITSATGSAIDHRDYGVWGNMAYESNPSSGDRFGWTGAPFDSATGLYLDHWRNVDPKAGRWTSQDPISFAAGDSNLYRYVTNSPAQSIDPSGTDERRRNQIGRAGSREWWNNPPAQFFSWVVDAFASPWTAAPTPAPRPAAPSIPPESRQQTLDRLSQRIAELESRRLQSNAVEQQQIDRDLERLRNQRSIVIEGGNPRLRSPGEIGDIDPIEVIATLGAALIRPPLGGVGMGAAAARRSIPSLIDEAAELGIGIRTLEIEGGVARIRISQTFTNSTADFEAFGQLLRQQGVTQVVVESGPVVARELALRYRSIAARGGTIRGGGRIRLVGESPCNIPGREGEMIPSFEIVFDLP